MIKFIGVDAVTLALGASEQAMPRAPLHQSDGISTQIAYGCGIGRTRVGGVCVSRRNMRGLGGWSRLPPLALVLTLSIVLIATLTI